MNHKALIDAIGLVASSGHSISPKQFRDLKFSSHFNMIEIFKDHLDRPIGYVAWAMINRESIDYFIKSGNILHYPHEWTEGGIFYIVDVFFKKDSRFDALTKLLRLLKSKRVISYFRHGKLKILIKENGCFRIRGRVCKVEVKKTHAMQ